MGTNENRVKKNRERDWTEFRYYAVPEDTHMLALQGDEWIQCFGEGVESLHFHNHMEIGYCYYGEGRKLSGRASAGGCPNDYQENGAGGDGGGRHLSVGSRAGLYQQAL